MSPTAPGRHGKSRNNRPFTVDGRAYLVSVSPGDLDEEKNVRLRVTFRADFGTRSACLVRGLKSRSYWQDYGEFEKFLAARISITPQIVCGLIRLAHQAGWDPVASKSNFEYQADRDIIRSLAPSTP
jgi:hypothetical protein